MTVTLVTVPLKPLTVMFDGYGLEIPLVVPVTGIVIAPVFEKFPHGVGVGDPVAVFAGVFVAVAVGVNVSVASGVGVSVAVFVAVFVAVDVGVSVGPEQLVHTFGVIINE